MAASLGERIRELRERKDLSLRELARTLDLSAPFISDIELGRRHPSENVLSALARVLGTTVDDLKSFDSRPPVEDIKRRAALDPAWGMALRRFMDSSPDDIKKFVQEIEDKKKQGPEKEP